MSFFKHFKNKKISLYQFGKLTSQMKYRIDSHYITRIFMKNDLLIITLTMHFLFDSFLISKVLNKKFGEVYKVFLIVTLHVSILCLHFLHFSLIVFLLLSKDEEISQIQLNYMILEYCKNQLLTTTNHLTSCFCTPLS